jgi:hypothetical protein
MIFASAIKSPVKAIFFLGKTAFSRKKISIQEAQRKAEINNADE